MENINSNSTLFMNLMKILLSFFLNGQPLKVESSEEDPFRNNIKIDESFF